MCVCFIFYFILLLFFCPFRATPVAYGGSQARSPVGATAANLRRSHSNAGSKPCLQLTPWLTTTLDSLAHWVSPGMEPATAWFLVRFVSTEPRRELLCVCVWITENILIFRAYEKIPERCYSESQKRYCSHLCGGSEFHILNFDNLAPSVFLNCFLDKERTFPKDKGQKREKSNFSLLEGKAEVVGVSGNLVRSQIL